MSELFVPYKESLELKELGFDGKCLAAYTNRGKFHQTSSDYWDNDSIKMIKEHTTIKLKVLAPLYQQVAQYLYINSNKQINFEINGKDNYKKLCKKLKKSIKDFRNLQNSKP